MSATSGPTSATPLAHYDQASSSWKMSQATFLSEGQPSLPTLPHVGMTHAGWLYALPMLGPAIGELGSSSLLATPRATRGGSTSENAKLLPTPVVNDMGDGKTPEDWDTWTEKMRTRTGNGNAHGKSLAIEVARLLPTPMVPNGGRTLTEDEVLAKGMTDKGKRQVDLAQVVRYLPTPKAHDAKGPNGENRNEVNLATALSQLPEHQIPKDQENTATEAAISAPPSLLLPTPTATDSKGGRNATANRKNKLPTTSSGWTLSDVFYGGTTSPPSDDTPTPGATPPRNQKTIWDD